MRGRKNGSQAAGLPAPGTRQRAISNLSVAPVKGPNGQLGVGLSVHFEGGAAPLTGVLQIAQARQLGELLITTARIAGAGGTARDVVRELRESWPSDTPAEQLRPELGRQTSQGPQTSDGRLEACIKCKEAPQGRDPGLSAGLCVYCGYYNLPPGPERDAARAARESHFAKVLGGES